MILRNYQKARIISLGSANSFRTIFVKNVLFDESNSDDKGDKTSKNAEVMKKLNNLIKTMAQKGSSTTNVKVELPKPREKARKKYELSIKEQEAQAQKTEEEQIGNQLAKAAAKVAETLEGDPKKTEMELLSIYLKHGSKVKPEHSDNKSVNEIIANMKVTKEKLVHPLPLSHRTKYKTALKTVDIFGEIPFNFFDPDKIKEKNVQPLELSTWKHFQEQKLKLVITQPPKNIFEQLILWTEQGKVWRFPIDNEQDWHEEEKYDFADHVFLERWLEPWCPESGPIRHFMELVCIGLSKNPYLTVPEKQAHIFWYEHYFRSKSNLIKEVGAGEIKSRAVAEEISG